MQINDAKLRECPWLNVHNIWVKAGIFSHRHPKDKPDPIQIERRQSYLDQVPDGEWLLVLDSDEEVFGGKGLFIIPQVLELANAYEAQGHRVDVICISEILPDFTVINRPRLIRKREGLKYGGPDQKHDYIAYCNHDWLHEMNDDTNT